jgi:hypothetical protein
VGTIADRVRGFPASLSLLEGPPGTGKTATTAALVSALHAEGLRVVVSAPSNKAVQVVAERVLAPLPLDTPAVVFGVDHKVHSPLLRTYMPDVLVRHLPKYAKWTLRATQEWCRGRDTRRVPPTRFHDYYFSQERVEPAHAPAAVGVLATLVGRMRLLTARMGAGVGEALEALHALVGTMDSMLKEAGARGRWAPLSDQAEGRLDELRATLWPALQAAMGSSGSVVEGMAANATLTFSTLCVLGRGAVRAGVSARPLDVLVVDEAGQSCEAETLIAFRLNPQHAVLVGDVHQLPATVQSDVARRHKFDRSIMSRLQVGDVGCLQARFPLLGGLDMISLFPPPTPGL